MVHQMMMMMAMVTDQFNTVIHSSLLITFSDRLWGGGRLKYDPFHRLFPKLSIGHETNSFELGY